MFKYARSAANIDWAEAPNGRQLPPKSYQYDAVIDLMLAEPGLSLSAIGARLGKSPAWMSYITKSDAFRDIYEERRRAKNAAIHEDLNNALTKVAKQGLDILSSRMEKNPNSVGIQQALDVADKALERLGYGVKLPGTVIDARSQTQVVLSEADFMRAQAVVRGLEADNALAAPPSDLEGILDASGFNGSKGIPPDPRRGGEGGGDEPTDIPEEDEPDDVDGEEERPSLSEEGGEVD